MNKRIFTAIVALIMAFAMCTDVGLAYTKSLEEIEKEIKQKEAELKEGQDKEKSLSSKVNELEQTIVDLDGQIAAGEVELDELKKD